MGKYLLMKFHSSHTKEFESRCKNRKSNVHNIRHIWNYFPAPNGSTIYIPTHASNIKNQSNLLSKRRKVYCADVFAIQSTHFNWRERFHWFHNILACDTLSAYNTIIIIITPPSLTSIFERHSGYSRCKYLQFSNVILKRFSCTLRGEARLAHKQGEIEFPSNVNKIPSRTSEDADGFISQLSQ